MITDIADYFSQGCGRCDRFATPDCSVQRWRDGLAELRRICLGACLVETLKWGHPCYTHDGRNVAIIGAFRRDFRLTFFNAALLQDAEKLLTRQGPNTQHADAIRFADFAQIAALAPSIRAYLAEAKGYAEAGLLPPKTQRKMDLPNELIEALDADPELAEAFHALTPGRQKSYVINLNGAKTQATRVARIAKFRGHILAGKGATER